MSRSATQQTTKKYTKKDAYYSIQYTSAGFRKPPRGCSFGEIVEYIRSCPASKDPRIIIEDKAIYFCAGLQEIIASFPELGLRFQRTKKGATEFTESNLTAYSPLDTDSIFKVHKSLRERQNRLQSKAAAYYQEQKATEKDQKQRELPDLTGKQPDEILTTLLAANKMVVIGEQHGDKSPKMIIDHMKELYQAGVRFIFLEHLFADTQAELLNEYYRSKSGSMPVMLKDYLNLLDKQFNLPDPYNFTNLVKTAKENGIRIIPIDTEASYCVGTQLHLADIKDDPTGRYLMMHYQYEQIHKVFAQGSPEQKTLVFVGSGHIHSVSSPDIRDPYKRKMVRVPGIKDISAHCPSVVFEDTPEKTSVFTKPNHPAHPDVLVCTDVNAMKKTTKAAPPTPKKTHKPPINPFFQSFLLEFKKGLAAPAAQSIPTTTTTTPTTTSTASSPSNSLEASLKKGKPVSIHFRSSDKQYLEFRNESEFQSALKELKNVGILQNSFKVTPGRTYSIEITDRIKIDKDGVTIDYSPTKQFR